MTPFQIASIAVTIGVVAGAVGVITYDIARLILAYVNDVD